MKKSIFISTLFLLIVLISNKSFSQAFINMKNKSCLEFIQEYGNLWRQDSLGKNGTREYMATRFLKKCNMVGTKWSVVLKSFGKPNDTFYLEGRNYRYRLNFTEKWNDIGSLLLEIQVNNKGTISYFKVYEIDG